MKKTTKLSPEVRERAVRMVFEQREQYAAYCCSSRMTWAA